ncbi:MAG: GNAT family N-acetyltransferase [Xenococcaceae cyanobacterium]
MKSQFEYSSFSNQQEAQQFIEIASQCFGGSSDDEQRYLDLIGGENFRVIRRSQKTIGGLAIYHMGQWFGSQSVPMAGIAAVAIAPEYRGSGAAFELLKQTLLELQSSGIPISTLYPATQVLYRKLGYEQGGSRCAWELPTESISLQDRDLEMRSVNPSEYKIFKQIYRQQAQYYNGNLDRDRAIWEQIIESSHEKTIYAYLIGSESKPEGYIIYTQTRIGEDFYIKIYDWAALTTSATKRLWTFLADHRSQITKIQWHGSTVDEKTLLLTEQTAKILRQEYWMLRIVDVVGALSKRGYPKNLEIELHLEVRDNLLTTNNGNFCLKVANGCGEVTPGGKGEFKLDIKGLASLYTGFYTPQQLKFIGYLDATEKDLEIAQILFSGSMPWMPDFF